MVEVAGGILLALLVILCLPLLLRGIAGLFVIGGVLLVAAFFIATEIGARCCQSLWLSLL